MLSPTNVSRRRMVTLEPPAPPTHTHFVGNLARIQLLNQFATRVRSVPTYSSLKEQRGLQD